MTKRLILLLNNKIRISWIFFIIIKCFAISNLSNAYKLALDNYNVPCGFLDSVDLRNSTKFSNGSYLYNNNILIPRSYIGIYDYELINISHRIEVPPYPRGCACELSEQKCIRWCCTKGEIVDDNVCVSVNETYNHDKEVVLTDGITTIFVDLYNYFIPQTNYRPCDDLYPLLIDEPDDDYFINEMGDVQLKYNNKTLDKNAYCFSYHNTTDPHTTIWLCSQRVISDIRILLNAYAMLFSIPFMIITIMVYTFIPELRNLHGKALSCYLIGLVSGYSLMCSQIFHKNLDYMSCHIVGFITYFSFMSAFFWLSVISFDLWWNFRGTRGRNLRDSKRFYIFSIYAWGLALICTGITVFMQLTDYIDEDYKPGIGHDFCWLNAEKNYSSLIYFYGPVLAIMIFNIIMFVITSLKIHHVQKEVARMIAREDSRKNLRTEKDQYGLFLRLFLVMGVTWSTETISYLIGDNHVFSWLFYFTDFCNAIQGFLIFALFVLKKKVKKLIFKRFKKARGINRSSQYSTKTSSSIMTMTTLNNSITEKPLMDPKGISN